MGGGGRRGAQVEEGVAELGLEGHEAGERAHKGGLVGERLLQRLDRSHVRVGAVGRPRVHHGEQRQLVRRRRAEEREQPRQPPVDEQRLGGDGVGADCLFTDGAEQPRRALEEVGRLGCRERRRAEVEEVPALARVGHASLGERGGDFGGRAEERAGLRGGERGEVGDEGG